MKQLLLVAVIHLLILHQYRKDKNEALAPKKDPPTGIATPGNYHDYWLRGVKIYQNDSLRHSAYQPGPYPNHYFSYETW